MMMITKIYSILYHRLKTCKINRFQSVGARHAKNGPNYITFPQLLKHFLKLVLPGHVVINL